MAAKWAKIKRELEADRARLQNDLERADELRQASLAPPDEPTYSNHLADEGSLTFQQEQDLALERHLSREIDAVDAALRRIEDGSYGICENCGKPIAMERLEALPTATLCIDCKSKQPARR